MDILKQWYCYRRRDRMRWSEGHEYVLREWLFFLGSHQKKRKQQKGLRDNNLRSRRLRRNQCLKNLALIHAWDIMIIVVMIINSFYSTSSLPVTVLRALPIKSQLILSQPYWGKYYLNFTEGKWRHREVESSSWGHLPGRARILTQETELQSMLLVLNYHLTPMLHFPVPWHLPKSYLKYVYFTDGETEIQKGYINCPRSYNC